jgi:N-methylhydantoinase B/oxoprolinase/acetone carboxylase alpha subunit
MAKYSATIDEDTRQRIIALPKGVHFSAFMRRAIAVFVEELEKDPGLEPGDFIITRVPGSGSTDKKR